MRISSEGTQKRIVPLGDPLVEGETPDRLWLYTIDGTPIDLSPDPTKMRWRGPWNPDTDYILNDVVTTGAPDATLYVLYPIESLPAGSTAPGLPGSEWVVMASSNGVVFKGEWAPAAYGSNSLVTHDNKLWYSENGVDAAPFEYIGGNRDSDTGSTGDSVDIPMPSGAAVGDLMVFGGIVSNLSNSPAPTSGGWTTLIEQVARDASFDQANVGVYAKIVTSGDLGITHGFSPSTSVSGNAQLHVLRGAQLPVISEVDFSKVFNDTLSTLLVTPAGADPAETTLADKVLHFFASMSQNFVNDTTDSAYWEAGALDGNDKLLSPPPNYLSTGFYWSDPGAVNPPDYIVKAGEHKGAISIRIRLPSPTAFSEDDWTPIAALGGLPAGGTDGQVLTKQSSTDGDVDWETFALGGLPAGGTDGQVLTKQSATDGDAGWETVTGGGGGGSIPRYDTVKTTASLAAATDTGSSTTRLAGGGESGVWTLAPGTMLTKISVNRPCRVRLYTTAPKRTADITRDRFTDPTGDHGCLTEFLLISPLTLDNIPADYLFSGVGDDDIYYRIENYDLSAGTVAVTLTVKDLEV